MMTSQDNEQPSALPWWKQGTGAMLLGAALMAVVLLVASAMMGGSSTEVAAATSSTTTTQPTTTQGDQSPVTTTSRSPTTTTVRPTTTTLAPLEELEPLQFVNETVAEAHTVIRGELEVGKVTDVIWLDTTAAMRLSVGEGESSVQVDQESRVYLIRVTANMSAAALSLSSDWYLFSDGKEEPSDGAPGLLKFVDGSPSKTEEGSWFVSQAAWASSCVPDLNQRIEEHVVDSYVATYDLPAEMFIISVDQLERQPVPQLSRVNDDGEVERLVQGDLADYTFEVVDDRSRGCPE